MIESIPVEPKTTRCYLIRSSSFCSSLAFLPVYFLTPSPRRWLPIVVGSYLFYMAWNVSLSVLLIALTLTAFGSAIAIEWSAKTRLRKAILIAGVCAELLPLFIFKYTNFVISTVNDLGAVPRSDDFAAVRQPDPAGRDFVPHVSR